MTERICYLYWIHRKGYTDIFTEGYIGITFNKNQRFKQHISEAKLGSKYIVHNAIRKYSDIEYTVLCVGKEEYIAALEAKLRNKPCIGWNIAVGGRDSLNTIERSHETIQKHAESSISIDKLTALNILVDYFENGNTQKEISNKYNICSTIVNKICSSKSKAFPEIKDVKLAIIDINKDRFLRGRLVSECLYDQILTMKEQGDTYKTIAKKFNTTPNLIKSLCTGRYKYLKNFSCYRNTSKVLSKYEYNGMSKTLSEWSKIIGINCETLRGRLGRGWNIEKAFSEKPKDKSEKKYTYKNKTLNLYNWEKEIGISRVTLKDRLKSGLTIEQAFEIPVNRANKWNK